MSKDNDNQRDVKLIRNIGIIAHIDAGKTTTTERILLYSGKIQKIGEVHDGKATMDFMEQEQERGITITSAATNCSWKAKFCGKEDDYYINIIDTPGHVDFTIEVERSLRVLDGGVCVIEGVAGIQTQTETVWRQADKYKVPRIVFVNKLDRLGADFFYAANTIKKKLDVIPLIIQIPVGKEGDLSGLIDLVSMKYYHFSGDKGQLREEREIPEDYLEKAQEYRAKMLEIIASEDDVLFEKYLEHQDLEELEIEKLIRLGTLKMKFFPVICGSAYKNIGVQSLLDAVIKYLPSPTDVNQITAIDAKTGDKKTITVGDMNDQFLGMVFKITRDKYAGTLSFLRVYSGTIATGDTVSIPRSGKKFRVGRIVQMHANSRNEIKHRVCAGDIIALIIDQDFATGETLCSMDSEVLLEEMEFPKKVLSRVIIPVSKSDQEKLSTALNILANEDPSFGFGSDDSGDTLIYGMGELHLEIKADILKREYKVNVDMKDPKVDYLETIDRPIDIVYKHQKQTGGSGQYAEIYLRIKPLERGSGIVFKNKVVGGVIPKEYIPSVEKGIQQAAKRGGKEIKADVTDFEVELYDGSTHDVDSSTLAFMLCGRYAMREAIEKVSCKVLEPVMLVEVDIPSDYLGVINEDLCSRRGKIVENITHHRTANVIAEVPLAEIIGYVTALRERTKGCGVYSSKFSHYAFVPNHIVEKLKKERFIE